MTKPTVLSVPAADRDLLDHWQSVTDDNGALVFADRLQEMGDHERAELVRVTVEIKRFPAVRDRNCKYGLPGEYVGPVDGHDAMRGDPCGRCNPSSRTLVKRRNDLEARLSVWPCPCGGGYRLGSRLPNGASERFVCPACGGSGDVLRQTTQAGILTPQFPLRWRAGYPYAATLLTLADAVEEVARHSMEEASVAGYNQLEWRPTPRLRALCDPERPPPWGVPLEAVFVADREPGDWRGQWIWVLAESPRHGLPEPVFSLLEGGVRHPQDTPEPGHVDAVGYPTPDAAKLAQGVALVALARGEGSNG